MRTGNTEVETKVPLTHGQWVALEWNLRSVSFDLAPCPKFDGHLLELSRDGRSEAFGGAT
jgi:hypothetical protein